MRINRNLAIEILKYLHKHPKFYFPFLVMCKEYTPEDDDFVEIEPNEWKLIKEDEIYQTFELRENLQNLYEETLKLMSKGFIEKITKESLNDEIRTLAKQYRKLYKKQLCESEKIEEYGENEFFGGKAEAYEDVLGLFERHR
ncbi:MAG: hypothetical protein WC872_02825 [Candidatus Absconditabacterales bacterium]